MSDGFRLEKHPIVLMQPSVVPPFGWVGHIPFAYLVVDLLRPGCIVELGTHSGNSYLAMCQAVRQLNLPTRCFAVDAWAGDSHAGYYGEPVFEWLRARHDPRYGDFSRLLRARFDDALAEFSEGSIDLLHIDGLHSYEAVKHDFESWLPKLSERAVVLLHDTASEDPEFGVRRFFDELSQRYASFDFLHSHGLGVVSTGGSVPQNFAEFMHAAQADPIAMRGFFEALAANLIDDAGGLRTVGHEPQPLVCHLYYRKADESFDEARKLSIQVDAKEKVLDVLFRLPSGISPDYLRIDPADHPGIYALQVWLRTDSNSPKRLLNDLCNRMGHVQGELMPDIGQACARLVSFDDDPYVEFEVGSEVGDMSAHATLEVTVRVNYEMVVSNPSVRRLLDSNAMMDMRARASARIDVQAVAREIEGLAQHQAIAHAEMAARLDKIEQAIAHAEITARFDKIEQAIDRPPWRTMWKWLQGKMG